MLEWKILYGNKKTFSNLDGEPWEAPRENVQVVVRRSSKDRGRWVTEPSNEGFWIWKKDRWYGVDAAGLWGYRYFYMEPLTVLYGTYIRDEDWEGWIKDWIRAELNDEKDAWTKHERLQPV